MQGLDNVMKEACNLERHIDLELTRCKWVYRRQFSGKQNHLIRSRKSISSIASPTLLSHMDDVSNMPTDEAQKRQGHLAIGVAAT